MEKRYAALKEAHGKLSVSILGGDESLYGKLVGELLTSRKLHTGNGIEIKLYNDKPPENATPNEEIQDAVEFVPTVSAALTNCDVLIILDELLRQVLAKNSVTVSIQSY